MTKLRELPWGKIALFGGLALLMTSSNTVVFREEWKLARQLHPQAQYRFLVLLQAIEAAGYRVVLTSAYRPGQESYHGFGLALDLNIIHIATGKWYKMATPKAEWEATGVPALMRSMGFRWGGDFVTQWAAGRPAYDPVHVDLGAVYAMADLRTAALRLAGSAAALTTFDRRKVALAA